MFMHLSWSGALRLAIAALVVALIVGVLRHSICVGLVAWVVTVVVLYIGIIVMGYMSWMASGSH